jgi:protein-tyrosine kinase
MSTIEKALAKKQAVKKSNDETNATSDTSSNLESGTLQEENSNPSQTSQNHVLQINKESLIERGYLIDTGERKNIKEEFREIKRKLLNNAFGSAAKTLNNSNLIMVSSAKPNEGKTFVSINLALSIALEQDKKVLLIDADVLMPSLHEELGIENTQGLIDFLLKDELSVNDVLYNCNIDNLKIIPAGNTHHLSNELLASEKMAKLAQELATRYPDRIVIFDCPPLLGISETQVLASLVGQGVIVVEESSTPIADVIEATKNLDEDLALGIVLNKAIRTHKDLYGYYGYGHAKK